MKGIFLFLLVVTTQFYTVDSTEEQTKEAAKQFADDHDYNLEDFYKEDDQLWVKFLKKDKKTVKSSENKKSHEEEEKEEYEEEENEEEEYEEGNEKRIIDEEDEENEEEYEAKFENLQEQANDVGKDSTEEEKKKLAHDFYQFKKHFPKRFEKQRKNPKEKTKLEELIEKLQKNGLVDLIKKLFSETDNKKSQKKKEKTNLKNKEEVIVDSKEKEDSKKEDDDESEYGEEDCDDDSQDEEDDDEKDQEEKDAEKGKMGKKTNKDEQEYDLIKPKKEDLKNGQCQNFKEFEKELKKQKKKNPKGKSKLDLYDKKKEEKNKTSNKAGKNKSKEEKVKTSNKSGKNKNKEVKDDNQKKKSEALPWWAWVLISVGILMFLLIPIVLYYECCYSGARDDYRDESIPDFELNVNVDPDRFRTDGTTFLVEELDRASNDMNQINSMNKEFAMFLKMDPDPTQEASISEIELVSTILEKNETDLKKTCKDIPAINNIQELENRNETDLEVDGTKNAVSL